jgi:hypothetical protein
MLMFTSRSSVEALCHSAQGYGSWHNLQPCTFIVSRLPSLTRFDTLYRPFLLLVMSDSDDDYLTDTGSIDDLGDHTVSKRDGTRSATAARGAAAGEKKKAAWENIERSWDAVTEGADGSINAAVQKLREQTQRRR